MLFVLALVLISFPGPVHTTADPSSRFELRWTEATAAEPHKLTFRRVGAGREELVREFDRHVEILWSPGGDSFIVNDYEGSDSSRAYVYSSRAPADGHELRADLPRELRHALADAHHGYVAASSWLSESAVLLKVSGYGGRDETGFDALVKCRKRDARWSCRAVPR